MRTPTAALSLTAGFEPTPRPDSLSPTLLRWLAAELKQRDLDEKVFSRLIQSTLRMEDADVDLDAEDFEPFGATAAAVGGGVRVRYKAEARVGKPADGGGLEAGGNLWAN